MGRPKVFQFWDRDPPDDVLGMMRTWRDLEGFDYRLFNDTEAAGFIRDEMGSRAVDAYGACAVPAMRADFFRYCALLVHGGIYVDADVRRIAPIRPLFDGMGRGLLMQRQQNIANDFIVVKRTGDPLLRHAVDRAIENIENRTSNNVWQVTGPGIMTSAYRLRGGDDALFAGFEVWPVAQVKKYVAFDWSLPYKRTGGHWVRHQAAKSIFRKTSGRSDGSADPT